jgi:hypothetical protein
MSVSFEKNGYDEPIARTRSGQEYYQTPAIISQRNQAKSVDRDAVVLSPKLAATAPLIGTERQYGWTTNDTSLYQNKKDYDNAKLYKKYETPDGKKWTADDAGRSGLFGLGYLPGKRLFGGKKTKRKRSRRTKKSRSYRKK